MSARDRYEMVIGLEVHCELKTASKIFCSCPTAFGAEPNTQCCPVCTGMPGALPVLNRQAVAYAVKAGLATNCRIASHSRQDRKNYFYPDLPKGYQISQLDQPLCENGFLEIETEAGSKRIGITRIHIEEDAGKLVHIEGQGTLVDCNRCGVPLIEIVSEPDLRSAEEAKAYLRKLRAVLLYTGVSDCRMNEGSMRCDVSLSVRRRGWKPSARTEMKNLNSFSSSPGRSHLNSRQADALEAQEPVVQETAGSTRRRQDLPMRRKSADDYRYFPDPDLPPIAVSREELDALRGEIPALPDERKRRYVGRWGLTPFAAELLTLRREAADYFEETAALTRFPALAANLIQSAAVPLLGQDGGSIPCLRAWPKSPTCSGRAGSTAAPPAPRP
ncbi:MAG: Asp-tRNA(Asn)/Glu-tRNA(Gln) amidotransferase subunit GatB [Anaerotruncus massiliensis (ex Togo et al. 2019)]